MPTYDYECKSCGHTWEAFQPITAKPHTKCPECSRKSARRVIGPGAAILFRGSGFYLTDYRSESYKKAAEADRKASEPAKTETNGSESKSSSKAGSTGSGKKTSG